MQNKEKFNYDILDKVANSGVENNIKDAEGKRFFSAFFIAMIGGRNAEVEMQGQKNELKSPPSYGMIWS